MPKSLVGQSLKRNEDPRLLSGTALFVDDVHLPNMAQAAFLRSPYAHARIQGIDVSAALRQPGVIAVFTARDLGNYWHPAPLLVAPPPIRRLTFVERTHPPLAKDKVRYAGEPVAVVIAESRYQAEDALDFIRVDYEPLPVVVDLEQAAAPGAVRVHDDLPDNTAAHVVQEKGSYAQAAADAALIVCRRFQLRPRHSRRHGEPRPGGQLGCAAPASDRVGHYSGTDPHPQWVGRQTRPV